MRILDSSADVRLASRAVSSAPAGRRICFLLRVRPERAQEYRERHGAVWPEMAPFFELEEGVAPDAAMTPLQEIFHLD